MGEKGCQSGGGRAWHDGSCKSCRRRMPICTSVVLLLLLLSTIRQRENPTDLEERMLSRETNATSPLVVRLQPMTSKSINAKNTVS